MSADLEELISELIAEGYTPREAAKVAAATLRAEKRQGLARRDPSLTVPSVQNHERRANYGEETAAQARERWEEQERMDPQGIYSGGSESGGIFGTGPIATESYDPAAMNRSMGMLERSQNARVQAETLKVLKELQENQERRQLEAPTPRPRRRFLPSLSKKKR